MLPKESGQNLATSAELAKLQEKLPSRGVDALIVLDAGYEEKEVEDKDGSVKKVFVPTIETKMRLWAAAQWFSSGKAKKIILCGGKLRGEGLPADSQIMKEFLLKPVIENRFGVKIPEEAIITEEKSRSTSENFHFVREILEEYPEIQTIGVISQWHQLIAGGKIAAQSLKMKTEFYHVEEALKARSPHYNQLIKDYYFSWIKRPRSKEFRHAMFTTAEDIIRLVVLIFDRQGRILSWLADQGITASTLYEWLIGKGQELTKD